MDFLKVKTLGLPRWAWLSILLAAIAIGLYLRHRAKVEEGEGTGEEAVSGPVGEYIEPPYEGEYLGGGGGGGSEYEGGSSTELNLERELQKEENQRIREGEKEENARLQYEAEHPPSGETAPSAQGAEQFTSAGPQTGTSETPVETKKKTAATGGGPPAKQSANVKASGVAKNGTKIAVGNAVAVGGGGGNSPVATNNSGGAPQNNAQHPAAVNTGKKCVNGGVGGHEAPSGWHLFCQGGYIWRAPNS